MTIENMAETEISPDQKARIQELMAQKGIADLSRIFHKDLAESLTHQDAVNIFNRLGDFPDIKNNSNFKKVPSYKKTLIDIDQLLQIRVSEYDLNDILNTKLYRKNSFDYLVEKDVFFRIKNSYIPTIKCIQLEYYAEHRSLLPYYKAKEILLARINKLVNQKIGIKKRPNAADLGKCPLCQEPLKKSAEWIFCSRAPQKECSFYIKAVYAKKSLSITQIRQLVHKGRTSLITGFISRYGNPFNAYLRLEGQKVSFEFQ